MGVEKAESEVSWFMRGSGNRVCTMTYAMMRKQQTKIEAPVESSLEEEAPIRGLLRNMLHLQVVHPANLATLVSWPIQGKPETLYQEQCFSNSSRLRVR